MEPKKPIPLLEKLVRVRRAPRSLDHFFTVIAKTLFRLDLLTRAPPQDFMREGFGPTPPSEPCESDSERPVKGRPLSKAILPTQHLSPRLLAGAIDTPLS